MASLTTLLLPRGSMDWHMTVAFPGHACFYVCGTVDQMVESLIHDQVDVGSNPTAAMYCIIEPDRSSSLLKYSFSIGNIPK